MDHLDLLHREPISHLPLSWILGPCHAAGDVDQLVGQAAKLLSDRDPTGEIVVIARQWPDLPARLGNIRIRCVVTDDIQSPGALSEAIALSRHSILLFSPTAADLDAETIASLVRRLDGADLVIGRRSGNAWNVPARLFESVASVALGIPVHDPLCPIRATRRWAVDRLEFQTPGELLWLEMIMKSTYLVSLIDEHEIKGRKGYGVLGTVFRSAADSFRMFFAPRFLRNGGKWGLTHELAAQESVAHPGRKELGRGDKKGTSSQPLPTCVRRPVAAWKSLPRHRMTLETSPRRTLRP